MDKEPDHQQMDFTRGICL